jgi:hypothetical protein
MTNHTNPDTGTALVPTGDDYIAQAVNELAVVDGKQKIDEAITGLQQQYGSLTVQGLNDRVAYIAAADGAKLVKKLRTGIEAKRKELNEFPLKFQRAVNAEAKRITELLQPIEAHLKTQVDRFEKAEEEAKKAQHALKHQQLVESGWQFNGAFYVCGPLSMPPSQAMELSDDRFEKALDHGMKELERQTAENKRREEEAKRQAEEAERLRKEQEQLQAEKAQMRQELIEARTMKMEAAGAELRNGWFYAAGERYGAPSDIANMEASQFAALIDRVKADIAASTVPAPEPAQPITINPIPVEEMPLLHPDPFGIHAQQPEPEIVQPFTGIKRPFEYLDGYDHCREQVLAILADPTPRRKSEIIDLVKALKP